MFPCRYRSRRQPPLWELGIWKARVKTCRESARKEKKSFNRPSDEKELFLLDATTFLWAAELDDHCRALPAGTVLLYSVLLCSALLYSTPPLLAH